MPDDDQAIPLPLLQLVHTHRERILASAAAAGVLQLVLSGSETTGDDPNDVEFIAEIASGVDYFDVFAFEDNLENILGQRVRVTAVLAIGDSHRSGLRL